MKSKSLDIELFSHVLDREQRDPEEHALNEKQKRAERVQGLRTF